MVIVRFVFFLRQYMWEIALVIVVVLIVVYFLMREKFAMGPRKRTVTLYYADWCSYCQAMNPVWTTVKLRANDLYSPGVVFNEVNCSNGGKGCPGAYPTIYLIDERGYRHEYMGTATYEPLMRWVIAPR